MLDKADAAGSRARCAAAARPPLSEDRPIRTARCFSLSFAASLFASAVAVAQTAGTAATAAGQAGMPMPAGVTRGDTALLTGLLGTRGPNGTATVDGRTVRVTLAGDRPGSTRPWYVHRGSCGRDEGMVGAASAYPSIVVDARGSGSGSVTLDTPLAKGGAYSVAIHSSATDANPGVIACGALTSAATSAGQASAQTMGGMRNMPMGNMPMGNMPMSGMQRGDPATPNVQAMDHSAMAMPGMPMPGIAGGAGVTNSASALLMAIHTRMMADPVIRERVMTDPVLRGMMARMPAGHGGTMTAGAAGVEGGAKARAASRRTTQPTTGGLSHHGMNMPGMPAPAKPAGKAVAKPTQKPAQKPAQKPTAKPAPKDSMPGMDHSKMPGMGKP